jgi:hypothetical protein
VHRIAAAPFHSVGTFSRHLVQTRSLALSDETGRWALEALQTAIRVAATGGLGPEGLSRNRCSRPSFQSFHPHRAVMVTASCSIRVVSFYRS